MRGSDPNGQGSGSSDTFRNLEIVENPIRLADFPELISSGRIEAPLGKHAAPTSLERRNPLFDGVTTGVIANGNFFYMANIQDEKKSGFIPISVLKIRL